MNTLNRRRFKTKAIAITLLTSFLLACLSIPVQAAENRTLSNSLELRATFNSISVYASFSGDDNNNSNATLRYREAGSGGPWIEATRMTKDRRSQVTAGDNTYSNPYRNQFRASIVGLEEGTTYEVEVRFTDPDGVSGNETLRATITTRRDTYPASGTTYYVDGARGSDSNPGTQSAPFKTIQRAADMVKPGDTVYIRGGTYREEVTLTRSGTANNWITFTNAPGERVVLDGERRRGNWRFGGGTFDSGSSSYVRLKGLEFRNASGRAIIININSTDIVIEDSVIADFGDNGIRAGGSSNEAAATKNIVIQRNQILRSRPKNDDSEGHMISFWRTQGGHVIRDNRIIDSSGTLRGDGYGYWDCIGGGSNFGLDGFVGRDSDIYNNTIHGCPDEGIEVEGGGMNVRVWNNTITDTFIGIGVAPVAIGPTYIFRNYISITGPGKSAAFKLGQASKGEIYFYHNTVYIDGPYDGFKQTNPGLANVTAKNNIIRAGRYIYEMAGDGADFSHNVIYTTDSGRFVSWSGTRYGSLSNFQSSGKQETGSRTTDPTSHLVAPVNSDYTRRDLRLKEGSSLVDTGVVLPGFNDPMSAWPFAGAAPDVGAYETSARGGETAPVITGGQPSGSLPAGTKSTTLEVRTDKTATCRYATSSGVSYASMPGRFDSTGGTTHTEQLTGLSDGNEYRYYVRCATSQGTANNTDYLVSFTVAQPNATAPQISGLTVERDAYSARVIWTTDHAANGSVRYGTSSGSLGQRVNDSAFGTAHTLTLSGLSPETTYYYQVESCNQSGQCSSSNVRSFTTTSQGPATIEFEGSMFTRQGYDIESSQGWIMVNAGAQEGTASLEFPYPSGVYDIAVRAIAENDGQSRLRLYVDNDQVYSATYPLASSSRQAVTFNIRNVPLNQGDEVKFVGITSNMVNGQPGSGLAHARLDRVTFTPVEAPPQSTPTPTATPTPTPTPSGAAGGGSGSGSVQNGSTPTPTPTPTATPTPTPTPTATPKPTATPTPTPVPTSTATPTPTPTPTSSPAANLATAELNLVSDWNLVSLNVSPTGRTIAEVLAPLGGKVRAVAGPDGKTLDPTRTAWNPRAAYWIRMSQPATLKVSGTPVDPSTPIELQKGWNTLAYLPTRSLPVAEALASIDGRYSEVRAYGPEGLAFVPDVPEYMNTLDTLVPGKGYLIYMERAATLVYASD